VIDVGQSLDSTSLKILEMSDTLLLVATLSLPCLTNVKRLLWTFRKLGYPQDASVKIVINRHQKNSVISVKEAEESLKKEFFWLIPNDFSTTMSAINQGKILSSVARGSEITESFRKLAGSFSGKVVEKK
jgi:pilus assembly protein CpaE